jgi:hypothetical protein
VFGEIGFEAATAHQPYGRTVVADEHARADAPVARAGNAHNGCEHHQFAVCRSMRKRVYDFAVRSHRSSPVISDPPLQTPIDFNVADGRGLV